MVLRKARKRRPAKNPQPAAELMTSTLIWKGRRSVSQTGWVTASPLVLPGRSGAAAQPERALESAMATVPPGRSGAPRKRRWLERQRVVSWRQGGSAAPSGDAGDALRREHLHRARDCSIHPAATLDDALRVAKNFRMSDHRRARERALSA